MSQFNLVFFTSFTKYLINKFNIFILLIIIVSVVLFNQLTEDGTFDTSIGLNNNNTYNEVDGYKYEKVDQEKSTSEYDFIIEENNVIKVDEENKATAESYSSQYDANLLESEYPNDNVAKIEVTKIDNSFSLLLVFLIVLSVVKIIEIFIISAIQSEFMLEKGTMYSATIATTIMPLKYVSAKLSGLFIAFTVFIMICIFTILFLIANYIKEIDYIFNFSFQQMSTILFLVILNLICIIIFTLITIKSSEDQQEASYKAMFVALISFAQLIPLYFCLTDNQEWISIFSYIPYFNITTVAYSIFVDNAIDVNVVLSILITFSISLLGMWLVMRNPDSIITKKIGGTK
jgi:hypothetical protein